MVDFKTLLNKRNEQTEQLKKKLNESQKKNDFNDKVDAWYPSRGKDGTGKVIGRFLPAPYVDLQKDEEADAYVQLLSYSFQNRENGRWYINNSRQSLGEDDPVAQYWYHLNGSGKKNEAKMLKRNNYYYANFFIIKDFVKKEDSGTLQLYRFGKSILDKANRLMNPQFEGEEEINPFHFIAPNFTIMVDTKTFPDEFSGKSITVPVYDDSTFASESTALFEDEDKMEELWKQARSLSEIVAPEKFKSYDELVKKLEWVMGQPAGSFKDGEFVNKHYVSIPETKEPEQGQMTQYENNDVLENTDDGIPPWDGDSSSDDQDDPFEALKREMEGN